MEYKLSQFSNASVPIFGGACKHPNMPSLFVYFIVSCVAALSMTTVYPPPSIGHRGFVGQVYAYQLNSSDGWDQNFFKSKYKKCPRLYELANITTLKFHIYQPTGRIIYNSVYNFRTSTTNYVLDLNGYYMPPGTGIYTFRIFSKNGVQISFKEGVTCGNDSLAMTRQFAFNNLVSGGHGKNTTMEIKEASILLKKGDYYPLKIIMFNWSGATSFDLEVTDPSGNTIREFGSQVFQATFPPCLPEIIPLAEEPEKPTRKIREAEIEKVSVEVSDLVPDVTSDWTETPAETTISSEISANPINMEGPTSTQVDPSVETGSHTSSKNVEDSVVENNNVYNNVDLDLSLSKLSSLIEMPTKPSISTIEDVIETSSKFSLETFSEIPSEISDILLISVTKSASSISSDVQAETSSDLYLETASVTPSKIHNEMSSETSGGLVSATISDILSESSSNIPSESSSALFFDPNSAITSEMRREFQTSSDITSNLSTGLPSETSSDMSSETSSDMTLVTSSEIPLDNVYEETLDTISVSEVSSDVTSPISSDTTSSIISTVPSDTLITIPSETLSTIPSDILIAITSDTISATPLYTTSDMTSEFNLGSNSSTFSSLFVEARESDHVPLPVVYLTASSEGSSFNLSRPSRSTSPYYTRPSNESRGQHSSYFLTLTSPLLKYENSTTNISQISWSTPDSSLIESSKESRTVAAVSISREINASSSKNYDFFRPRIVNATVVTPKHCGYLCNHTELLSWDNTSVVIQTSIAVKLKKISINQESIATEELFGFEEVDVSYPRLHTVTNTSCQTNRLAFSKEIIHGIESEVRAPVIFIGASLTSGLLSSETRTRTRSELSGSHTPDISNTSVVGGSTTKSPAFIYMVLVPFVLILI